MRWLLVALGAVLILAGGVWLLQGIGVLPGSFMTGQTRWAIIGSACVVVGLGLLTYTLRRNRGSV